MADILVHELDELPYYQGEHAIPGIRFRSAGRLLGVSAWGMNVLEIEAGCTGYPAHDHVADGQEEAYVVLRGSAVLHTEQGTSPMPTGSLVRVPPEVRRWFTTDTGVWLLAIGATPGQAYDPAQGV